MYVHVHVCGEWACHKRSSTRYQGWAPCVLLFYCLFIHFIGWGVVGFLSPQFTSVLYMYMYREGGGGEEGGEGREGKGGREG